MKKQNILDELKIGMSDLLSHKYYIEVYDVVTSTNTMLLERIKSEKLPEGYTIIANEQTAGVGRHGRTFHSPEGTGVYMSVLLKPRNISKGTINMITVAAAVATANAIEGISRKRAKIKWVNDIYVEEKKVAGILAQGQINHQTGEVEQIVLGVGVNLYEPIEGFHQEIKDTAGYVLQEEEIMKSITSEEKAKKQGKVNKHKQADDLKARYIATLLNTFFEFYERLEDKSYVEEYISRSLLIGKKVEVIQNEYKKTAKVLEINSDCNLVVEYENGEVICLECGEVSLKV